MEDAAQRHRLGVAWMVFTSLQFAVMGLWVKLVAAEMPSDEIVFWRSLVTFVVLLPFAMRMGEAFRPRAVRAMVLRGLTGTASMMSYFYAIQRLPLGDAVMISYASPLVVALLSPWVLGERPSSRVWGALLLGFLGVALVAGPKFQADPLGVTAALATALFAGLAYLYVAEASRTERNDTIVLWFAGIAALVTSPFLLPAPTVPSAGVGWTLFGVGLIGLTAQLTMTRAYQYGEAASMSLYGYVTPVAAWALGWLALGEAVTVQGAVGTVLVAVAGGIASRR